MPEQILSPEKISNRDNELNLYGHKPGSINRRLLRIVPALVLALFIPVASLAQDSGTAPPSDLDKAKTEAETRKAIAEARKAELEARFPKPSTSPLEGKTTTDGEFIEGQIAAYLSMTDAAERIAQDLAGYPGIQTLVVHKQTDFALLQNYYAGRNRITMLTNQFTTLTAAENGAVAIDAAAAAAAPAIPVPVLRPGAGLGSSSRRSNLLALPLALGAATSTVGAFNDFLGAFRTDVSIYAKSVEVTEDAVVAELFKALRVKYPAGVNLYYPGLVPPKVNTLGPSGIVTAIEGLYAAKEQAELGAASVGSVINKKQEQIDGLNQFMDEVAGVFDDVKAHNDAQIVVLKEQVVELQKEPIKNAAKIAALTLEIGVIKANTNAAYATAQAAQAPYVALIDPLKVDIAMLQRSSKPLEDLIKQFDNLIKELLKTDDSGGISLINSYVQTENLIATVSTPNSYFLAIGFVKGGGNQKVARNLIADVFRGGSKISYSGGVILKYNLFTPDGRSVLSNTTKRYEKYMSAKEIAARSQ
jgi:hypothetical protein